MYNKSKQITQTHIQIQNYTIHTLPGKAHLERSVRREGKTQKTVQRNLEHLRRHTTYVLAVKLADGKLGRREWDPTEVF